MRNLLIILGLLATLLAMACFMDTQSNSVRAGGHFQNDPWRRTEQGWEKNGSWNLRDDHNPVAAYIHPALVASFQVLACVGGMLAMGPNKTIESAHGDLPASG